MSGELTLSATGKPNCWAAVMAATASCAMATGATETWNAASSALVSDSDSTVRPWPIALSMIIVAPSMSGDFSCCESGPGTCMSSRWFS